MEQKQSFAIGDRVEQMCVKCGEERGHIVASVTKTGKVSRVSCPICASRVPYKSGTTRFTIWPVSRSIARMDNSSTGATMVMALP